MTRSSCLAVNVEVEDAEEARDLELVFLVLLLLLATARPDGDCASATQSKSWV